MSLGNTKTVDDYDFSEDAMGLETFIANAFKNYPDAFPVIYVYDQDGNSAVKAKLIEETLTDGSKTYNIEIVFER